MAQSYAVASRAAQNGTPPPFQKISLKQGLRTRLRSILRLQQSLKPERYLTECLSGIAERLNARGGQVLVAPTGSGKSTLAVELAKKQRVYVIAPTKPLGAEYIAAATAADVNCSHLDGDTDQYDRQAAGHHDQLTVCTIQQFVKIHREGYIRPTDLVLLDELSFAFKWMSSTQWQQSLRYVLDLLSAGKIHAMDATPPDALLRALELPTLKIEPAKRTARSLIVRCVSQGGYDADKIALAAIHQAKNTGKLCIFQIKDKARLEALERYAKSMGLRTVVATSETWETDECQALRDGQAGDLDVLLCTNILEAGKSLYAPEREAEIHLIDRQALPREFVQFAARLRTFRQLECYHYISETRTPKSTKYTNAYRDLLANVTAVTETINTTKGLKLDGVELRNYSGKHATDFIRVQDGQYAPCKATIAHYLEGEYARYLPAEQFAEELQNYTRDQVQLIDWQPATEYTTAAQAIRDEMNTAKIDARQDIANALTESPEIARAGLSDLWQSDKCSELLGDYTAKQKADGRQLLKACGAHRVKGYLQQLYGILALLLLLQKHRIANAQKIDIQKALATLFGHEPKDVNKLQKELETLALHEFPTSELSTKERYRRRHLEGKLKRMDRLTDEWYTLEELQSEWNKYTQKGSALAKAERITTTKSARLVISRYYVLDERRPHGNPRKQFRIVRRKTLADTLENFGLMPRNSSEQDSDSETHSEHGQSARYVESSERQNPYNNRLIE